MIPHVDFDVFLDRPKIIRRLNAKKRRILARTGGFGRKLVKQQLGKKGTKRQRHSLPGQSPRKQLGFIHLFTYFGLDFDTDSVVIGPKKLDIAADSGLVGKESVPQLLEEGGYERLQMPGGKIRNVHYEPRPFLSPVEPTITDFFRKRIEEEPL